MNCKRRKTGVSPVMADRHLACRGITVAAAPTGWKPVGHDSRDGSRNWRKNHEQAWTSY